MFTSKYTNLVYAPFSSLNLCRHCVFLVLEAEKSAQRENEPLLTKIAPRETEGFVFHSGLLTVKIECRTPNDIYKLVFQPVPRPTSSPGGAVDFAAKSEISFSFNYLSTNTTDSLARIRNLGETTTALSKIIHLFIYFPPCSGCLRSWDLMAPLQHKFWLGEILFSHENLF